MASIKPAVADNPPPLSLGLSFLAPATLVLLPALVLAGFPGEKNEAYEWTQHRAAGLSFAAAFASVLLGGCWRKGRLTALVALVALAALATIAARGLPEFHMLFEVGGCMVAFGYWHAHPHSRPPFLEIVAVGFSSVLCFWAVSRLLWWQPFGVTMAAWFNKAVFLSVTALLIGVLSLFANGTEPNRSRTWVTRGLDLLALLGLAVAAMRTNSLSGNLNFPHHWSVYATSVDLVREGRVLFGEVPSQYGFLSILVAAALPTDDSFTALYWLNVIMIWASGGVVYFTLRTWLSQWYWQLSAALIAVASATLLSGYAPDLSGPMLYPSVGAMRFIWVYVLLGFLLWRHLTAERHIDDRGPDEWAVWTGSSIWLVGMLWSVESAAYVTAAWFPAGAILGMNPAPEGASRVARCRALLAGISRSLLKAAFLLALVLLVIGSCYWFGLGRLPVWSAYWEYAAAFSQGFGVLPIEPHGGVWVLLLLHAALLAAIVSVDPHRNRSVAALVWAAWGAFWAVSTYYISRSHVNNITNLNPVLLLVVGLLVHALRSTPSHHLARPWLWLTVPPFVSATLWLVLTNQAALGTQIADYAVEPQVSRLLPPRSPKLDELIAQCLARRPGSYIVIGHSQLDVIRIPPVPGQPAWLPIASLPLLVPLSENRQLEYLDIYRRDRTPGWFIAPVSQFEPSPRWLISYIESRYRAEITLSHDGWNAWFCVPNSAHDARPVPQN